MQDISKKDKTALELAKRGDLLQKFHVWVQTITTFQLVMMAAVISGLGAAVDLFLPILAFLDVGLLTTDEVLVGAPPVIILLEVLRRLSGWDGVTWLHEKVTRVPSWALVVAMGAMAGVTTGFAVSIYIPVVGLATWPVEFFDGLVVGLPTLLSALELRKRWRGTREVPESHRLDVPASSTAEK